MDTSAHNRFHFFLSGRERGGALLEMAIVLPVFIFLFIAIVDFGLYFNKKNVAQSAAWNGAKECIGPLGGSPMTDGAPLLATSVMAQTLPPLISYDTSAPNGLVQIPQCSAQNSGGAAYMMVTVSVQGSMLSFFTKTMGLYPIIAVGIAN